MKALVVDGRMETEGNYPISEGEKTKRRAIIGSQVWKNITFEIKDVPTPNLL